MSDRIIRGQRRIWGAAIAMLLAATVAGRAVPIRDIRVAPVGDVPVSAEQVLAQVSARVGQELDRAAFWSTPNAPTRRCVSSIKPLSITC